MREGIINLGTYQKKLLDTRPPREFRKHKETEKEEAFEFIMAKKSTLEGCFWYTLYDPQILKYWVLLSPFGLKGIGKFVPYPHLKALLRGQPAYHICHLVHIIESQSMCTLGSVVRPQKPNAKVSYLSEQFSTTSL